MNIEIADRTIGKTCSRCGFAVSGETGRCPRCGMNRAGSSRLRVLGGLIAVIGLLLMGGMAVLSYFTYDIIRNSHDPRATTRFTGSESDMMFAFGVFALVFFFGLTAFSAGIWQLIFGWRNMLLVWGMLLLGAVFFIAGSYVKVFL